MDPKKNQAIIIWLTGMSGSGKSTHSKHLKVFFDKHGYSIKILDGDTVRKNDGKKLGFGFKDVRENNLRIAQLRRRATKRRRTEQSLGIIAEHHLSMRHLEEKTRRGYQYYD